MTHPSDLIPRQRGHRLGELGQDAMLTSGRRLDTRNAPEPAHALGSRGAGPSITEADARSPSASGSAALTSDVARRDRHAPGGRSHPASGMEDVQRHFERS